MRSALFTFCESEDKEDRMLSYIHSTYFPNVLERQLLIRWELAEVTGSILWKSQGKAFGKTFIRFFVSPFYTGRV